MAKNTQFYNAVANSFAPQSVNATINNSGGESMTISIWERLERFLILGSDSNTAYQTAQELTIENSRCVLDCIAEDGAKAVRMITEISDSGRAARNDAALFALAICAGHKDSSPATRQEALRALPKVARIGTHLFQFVNYVDKMRGWGRGLRNAVADWYLKMPVDKLALQVVKYVQRTTEEGVASSSWSHRDLLRLSHPRAEGIRNEVLRYAVKGTLPETSDNEVRVIIGTELIKAVATAEHAAQIVADYNLPHEVVPKQFANSPEVWRALLPNMGMTALLRTLNRLSSYGVATSNSSETKQIVAKLSDTNLLRKARVHPVAVLNAMRAYQTGTNRNLTWQPVTQIVATLEEAFYNAFEFVEPTGKNFVLGLDVSGSMTMGSVAGLESLKPYEVTAVMSMVTARREPNYFIMGFSNKFVNLGITASDTLASAMKKTTMSNFGSTNCALAIEWATKNNIPVDAFVIYTDNEHNTGNNPNTALRNFRQKFGRNTKGIAVATTGSGYSIFDSSNPWALNLAGFDAAGPALIADFTRR